MHQFKKGIKIIGIACSSFNRTKDQEVAVIGAIYRGASLFEGMIKTAVQVDGEEATDKIADMIKNSTHWQQLKVIMTRGVTIAGFNCLSLKQLSELTSLPVISIVDRKPDMDSIKSALQNLPNSKERFQILEENGLPIQMISSPEKEPVFVQFYSLTEEEVKQIITNATIVGRIPEPLRVARLIAVGLTD
ncbi:MAG: DUF99 family protein [Asgard group archaeon]|nr:DUF99 family protein [Asgard group archaeon]